MVQIEWEVVGRIANKGKQNNNDYLDNTNYKIVDNTNYKIVDNTNYKIVDIISDPTLHNFIWLCGGWGTHKCDNHQRRGNNQQL